jgi:hypothetical protein
MLYINAYKVYRAYGGPEEGGWWYDMGTPVASIPISTEYRRGQEYFFQSGEIVIQKCRYCEGQGTVACEDPNLQDVCDNCGEIPSDKIKTESMMAELQALLEQEEIMGRREELRISLETCMGEAYPDSKPTYE